MYYKRIYYNLVALVLFVYIQPSIQAQSKQQPQLTPGIALTFDDHYVAEWLAADSAFAPLGFRATFFVAGYEKLSSVQKAALLQLQAKGHEIGFHGDHHLSALPYIQQNGLAAYLQNEFTQLQPMKAAGLNILSFAYPSGSRNAATDSALQLQFLMLRGVAGAAAVKAGNAGFYSKGPEVDAIGMEYQYRYFSDTMLLHLLNQARQQNGILVLYGHRPVPVPDTTKHEVAYATLKTICEYAARYHLKLYTFSELARLSQH